MRLTKGELFFGFVGGVLGIILVVPVCKLLLWVNGPTSPDNQGGAGLFALVFTPALGVVSGVVLAKLIARRLHDDVE